MQKRLFTYIRERTKEPYKNYYALTNAERRDIIHSCSAQACLLMEYYLRMASIGSIELDDQGAADYFNWKTSAIKRYRLTLQKQQYFKRARQKGPHGEIIWIYYLGKPAVRDTLPLSEHKAPAARP